MMNQISNAWLVWIKENLNSGCSPHSLLEVMIKENVDAQVADKAISELLRKQIDNVDTEIISNQYSYETSHIPAGNQVVLSNKTIDVAFRLKQPDIVLINNFLSDAECEALINLSSPKLLPSTVIDVVSGGRKIHELRTSDGMSFKRGENELIKQIESRISELVNLPIENGEGIQVLHYRVGAQYRPHYDYFPENETGGKKYIDQGGQRIVTLIMYLNDVEAGGETIFPEINLSVTPKRGSILYFSYLNSLGQLDEDTLHGGAPVINGDKWIATKWIRKNRYSEN